MSKVGHSIEVMLIIYLGVGLEFGFFGVFWGVFGCFWVFLGVLGVFRSVRVLLRVSGGFLAIFLIF